MEVPLRSIHEAGQRSGSTAGKSQRYCVRRRHPVIGAGDVFGPSGLHDSIAAVVDVIDRNDRGVRSTRPEEPDRGATGDQCIVDQEQRSIVRSPDILAEIDEFSRG